jgi:hypothetical protein
MNQEFLIVQGLPLMALWISFSMSRLMWKNPPSTSVIWKPLGLPQIPRREFWIICLGIILSVRILPIRLCWQCWIPS